MKANTISMPLLLLLFATGLYAPIKAVTSEPIPTHKHPPCNTIISHWFREIDSNISLKQDVIKMITDYTLETQAYIFVGPTDSGKSTAIFALQGNKVIKNEEESSDNNGLDTHNKKPPLIFEQTVELESPPLGRNGLKKTEMTKRYNVKDNTSVFLYDTTAFGSWNDQKVPFLTFNETHRGSIVIVISSYDILNSKPCSLNKMGRFILRKYSDWVGDTALRQSILLMVTKCEANKAEVQTALLSMIQKSYRAHFEQAKNIDNKDKAKFINIGNTQSDTLQPFFAMLLKDPVDKEQADNVENFRLDNERVFFFNPCDSESISNTWDKLGKLHSIPTRQRAESLNNNQYQQQPESQNNSDFASMLSVIVVTVIGAGAWMFSTMQNNLLGVADVSSVKDREKIAEDTREKYSTKETTTPNAESTNTTGWGFQEWCLLIIFVILVLGSGYWYFQVRKKN